jgi:hypothetical protein
MRGNRIMLVSIAIVLGGCGGGASTNGEATKPAGDVLADAKQAALAAESAHISGSIVEDGAPITLDLQLLRGTGAKGTMSENRLRFDVIRAGSAVYIRGSDAFLRKFAGAGGVTLLHGRWLKGSSTSGDLAALTPLTDLAKLFNGALGTHGTLKNRGETTHDGKKVVAIRDASRGGTLYVAATGTPYPVAIAEDKGRGELRFDKWNESVSVKAPKDAVDMSKLGG